MLQLMRNPFALMTIIFASMLLTGGLTERASKRFALRAKEVGGKPHAPFVIRLLGVILFAAVVFVVIFMTNLLAADGVVLALCVATAVGYVVRIKALAVAGASATHLSPIVASLCLWLASMAWFMHLAFARFYAAL